MVPSRSFASPRWSIRAQNNGSVHLDSAKVLFSRARPSSTRLLVTVMGDSNGWRDDLPHKSIMDNVNGSKSRSVSSQTVYRPFERIYTGN